MKIKIVSIIFLLFISAMLPAQERLRIDSLKNLLNTDNIANRIIIHTEIGDAYRMNYPDTSLANYKAALKYAESLGDNLQTATALKNIGGVYYIISDFPKSMEYSYKALKIFEQLQDKEGISRCYNNLGLIYTAQGSYAKAIDAHMKSLKLAEETFDKKLISTSYNNLGLLYNEQNNYDKAEDYFDIAYSICKELNDKPGLAKLLNNLGTLHIGRREFDSAEFYLKQSFTIADEIGDKLVSSKCLINIGLIHNEYHDYAVSKEYYLKAFDIMKDIDDKTGISTVYINLGTLSLEQKNYKEAIEYLEKGLRISKDIGALNNLNRVYENLSTVYMGMGDYRKAFEYYKLFKETGDSLFNENVSAQIKQIESRYTTDKQQMEIDNLNKEKEINDRELAVKEKEVIRQRNIIYIFLIVFVIVATLSLLLYRENRIKKKTNAILTKRNFEIHQQNEKMLIADKVIRESNELLMRSKERLESSEKELRELNAAKDKFFSIIAHDLRGPFQGFLGFSDILAKEAGTMSRAEIIETSVLLNDSLKKQFTLLNDLLDWTRLESGNYKLERKAVNLHDEVQKVFENLEILASQKEIALRNKIDLSTRVDVDLNMVKLLFRNLLSNSIKFTNRGGYVNVKCAKANDYIVVTIEDNGVGIAPENINKLFVLDKHYTTAGTESEAGTGLGLVLCREIVEKHGCNIRVESTVSEGSKFIFTLPEAI
ncbi:MAG: tetratricopeptide repeat-containing sensor histidine kinase [Ignavibacteria bacterium]|nr:tetratricopeptide repeat-containing sensor histidine kinase [Ignavibacteria bacterium]